MYRELSDTPAATLLPATDPAERPIAIIFRISPSEEIEPIDLGARMECRVGLNDPAPEARQDDVRFNAANRRRLQQTRELRAQKQRRRQLDSRLGPVGVRLPRQG
jgi:hypothetical protein